MGGLSMLDLEHIASTHILVIRPHLIVRGIGKCQLSATEEVSMDFGK